MPGKKLAALARELSVTQYLEYQDYLAALYQLAKERHASYSYLRFAEDLGFSATNVLRLVIARKRRLAEKSARTIAEALDLRNEERNYFLNVVRYGNVPSQETKAAIFLQIYRDKKTAVADHADSDLMEYYASWLHPLILELIHLPKGSQEPEHLARRVYPHLTAEQMSKGLELLQKLKMIQWDEGTGRWRGVDDSPRILPEDQAAGVYSVVQFHQQMIKIAAQCLLLVPRHEREYNALTLRLSNTQIPQLKDRIRAFCAEVMAMEEQAEDSDRVIQVNIQMFPFTRLAQDEEKTS
ncbi:MAG TPA: TIGR02147 family protein [Oligoflexus sp.]|uniref:TIGR02147 family protein n=1 Tax=Oligoflexus sp. TaxID=1971216 RepID=UPI002D6703A0|nr:TIGR02147 family protein [Oligoflexus sp.]HYX37799.1 TIGR02147 family protein [Oligoflexus sp.]